MGSRSAAELIVHLGRLAYTDGVVCGLTPAQWAALRYYAWANRFSRTPSAFAEYHGTTRGTASQITKTLVAQGHLARTRSKTDGRSARLDLTDKGRTILADDPFRALVRAVGALSSGSRDRLGRTLERLLSQVAHQRCKHPFGSCTTCDHLEGDGQRRHGQPPYRCGFVGEPLTEAEFQQLCINFAPAGSQTAARDDRPAGRRPRLE
jgi:DNA-binding MarR family transcriptional regulator